MAAGFGEEGVADVLQEKEAPFVTQSGHESICRRKCWAEKMEMEMEEEGAGEGDGELRQESKSSRQFGRERWLDDQRL